MQPARVATVVHRALLPQDLCWEYYQILKDCIQWEPGVRSKNGFTRWAKVLAYGDHPVVDEIIQLTVGVLLLPGTPQGIYLNYYPDGTHWCPNHSHPGTKQLVISLGATRTFKIGSRDYQVSNGDVAIFGSAVHGLPKDPQITAGRISIALFMDK